MPAVEADPDGRPEVVEGEFGEVPADDGFVPPVEADPVEEAPDDAEEDVPPAGAADVPFAGVAPDDPGEAVPPEPALAEPVLAAALAAATGDGPSAFPPLAAGDPAVAAFGAPAEAALAGLAAALAMPAFEGALGETAAGEAVAGEAAEADAAPVAAAGFVGLGVDAPELAAAEVEAAADAGAAAGDAAVAPPFSGACALGRSVAASALASGLASGLAAGVAVVFSPSLTVVFFSALRSIVWPRVFVGRERRGRLVIASAPCLRSRRRPGSFPRRSISARFHWSFIRAHGASTEFTWMRDVG
ncbi:hypothetical protein [Aurantimonas sp. 22II-16-19i]|uniref:hypothetical protein n=1 Tax=Aurantimonas sp. 22II-16-19i TaxID=1317114 RepID=UPI00111C71F5|nr:hypothetical protein [Aurantimonas sp. 22II-16-19i]